MFLHTFHPSPILVSFGPFTIRWYGLCLALGALAGFLVITKLSRAKGLSVDQVTTAGLLAAAVGFVGARLYHVLNEPAYYWNHPSEIIAVWHGGLAIHGGLIAGALTVLWYARKHHLSFLLLTDILAPAVAIGQAIGRWGNYFNQELFGRPTTLPWGIPIDAINRPTAFATAEFFHPTFAYECLWDLASFGILLLVGKRKSIPAGTITVLYLGLIGAGRLMTEFLRIDRVPVIAGVRLPLLVSGMLVLFSAVTSILLLRRSRYSKVETA